MKSLFEQLKKIFAQPRREAELPNAFQGRVPLTEEILDRAKSERRG